MNMETDEDSFGENYLESGSEQNSLNEGRGRTAQVNFPEAT